ncbi:unnamed protein product [Ixodes hexagonus]
MDDDSNPPSLRRRSSHPPPRPSSSCLDAFRRQKLRYAEALKRHFIDGDDVDASRKGSENGATSSKRRHLSAEKRRLARPLSVNGAQTEQNAAAATRKSSRPKSCSRCSKMFPSAVELQKHSASHGGSTVSDITPYKCPLCSQAFQTLSVIKAHVNAVHV